MQIRKTKIVATIGPATIGKEKITKMIKTGMNVARLNFSHGDHSYHEKTLNTVRAASKKLNTPVAVIQDLSGPKIRTGELYKDKVFLKKGTKLTLTTKRIVGDETKQFVNYKKLPKEVKKGDFILLDDGKKKLQVVSTNSIEIKCKVITGGEIAARRGVNVPGVSLSISSITEKDKKDIMWGVKHDVDFMALSFVKNASDVKQLKRILKEFHSDVNVIAKIETYDAIDDIDNIINETDGVMVARGDLAVETPPEEVPILQKKIIEKCNRVGKPVIVATQMLESMITSPVPTRAEVSDVANSIVDGADAVMLSAETATGSYPIDAVKMMSNIAKKTEAGYLPHARGRRRDYCNGGVVGVVDAITRYVVATASDVGAEAIVALTQTGSTARMVSRHRPKQPIVVLSANKKTLQRTVLSFGCYPREIGKVRYIGEAIERIKKIVVKEKFVKVGDKFVLAAGVPFGKIGGTNIVMVQEIKSHTKSKIVKSVKS
jgi:pyruvate kinase